MSESFFERVRMQGNPLADPRNVVVHGSARFTLLTPRLLRLEWSETGTFEDRGSFAFPQRQGAPVPHQLRVEGAELVIETAALALRYRPDGGPFTEDNLLVTFDVHGRPASWRPGQDAGHNLRGTARTLDGCHGDISLEPGLLSRAGWALFDDSANVLFDDAGWVSPRPDHALQDWYFFGYGRDYKSALLEYTWFGGQVPLIPRYALGAWWSRYWDYHEQDLRALVADFAAHELPLDVLVVDMDWHTPDTWTGYTWNNDLFPDPPAFLAWLHEQRLRVSLNLHPADGVQHFEAAYAEFARAMGANPQEGTAVPFDSTDPLFMRHYFELLHHPLEEQGVDFWWIDWQQGARSAMRGLDPLPWLNHLHFADAARRGERPLIFSRWGGLGNHRYPIGFSGDTLATWESLQFQPTMTATAGNVGYGWWSHDIGGHMGGATPPELYARWVQFGALSPALRLHAGNDPRAERRPWAFAPEIAEAARQAFRLRYQLIPYLYTMARLNTDTNIGLCRPMYYEHPESDSAYAARYQYYLGDQLIAAPIVFPADVQTGLAAADVWLPEGQWLDTQTLEQYAGPRWVRVLGDIERVPLFAKAGAIVPQAPPVLRSAAIPAGRLILSLYPGESGSARLYEDDGHSQAYQAGAFEWTGIEARIEDGRAWHVHVAPVAGACAALPRRRSLELRLHGSRPPDQVTIEGAQPPAWTYDAATLCTTIHVPDWDKRLPLALCATAVEGIVALGTARNQELIAEDVRRLTAEPAAAPHLDAVLPADTPAKLDAVARLGGPFVRHIPFTSPQEAAQQLGRVIVAAPAGDHAYSVRSVLRRYQSGQPLQEQTVRLEGSAEATIFDLPYRFEGEVRATRWTADTTVHWAGRSISSHYESGTLFPTIPVWHVLVAEEEELPPLEQLVLADDGRLNPALPWQQVVQKADALESLDDPHVVRLTAAYADRLHQGQRLAAYLAVTIDCPADRAAAFVFYNEGPAALYLNREPLSEAPLAARQTEFAPFYHKFTRRSAPLALRHGRNTLVAWTGLPDKRWPSLGNLPQWVFGGYFATDDGRVMSDLAFH